ncbi:MAG: hypothetical protein KF791_16430 [Verrucomicrobiae bacterium]|nr:hypothetical protein [Verrucomicrobiae bacterium]
MKNHSPGPATLLMTAVALVAVVAAAGCASTKQTEDLLSAAGFRILQASTPAQQEKLKGLPPDKVSMVPRDGTNYFVFPVPKEQVLYVGEDAQYQEYQRLRLQQERSQEQLTAAQLNSMPVWDGWGAWGAPVYVAPRPYIRR